MQYSYWIPGPTIFHYDCSQNAGLYWSHSGGFLQIPVLFLWIPVPFLWIPVDSCRNGGGDCKVLETRRETNLQGEKGYAKERSTLLFSTSQAIPRAPLVWPCASLLTKFITTNQARNKKRMLGIPMSAVGPWEKIYESSTYLSCQLAKRDWKNIFWMSSKGFVWE